MNARIRNGTDQSLYLVLRDGNGDPVTTLLHSSGQTVKWWRPGDATPTAVTLATQTINGAHSDGGFVHVEEGLYRLDPPDAAFASSTATEMFVYIKHASIKSEWIRVPLADYANSPTLQQIADGIADLLLVKGRTLRKLLSVVGSALFGTNAGTASAPQLKSIDAGEANVLITSNGDRTTKTVDWTNA